MAGETLENQDVRTPQRLSQTTGGSVFPPTCRFPADPASAERGGNRKKTSESVEKRFPGSPFADADFRNSSRTPTTPRS